MRNHHCTCFLLVVAGLVALHARTVTAEQANIKRYNVLFIAIDDLNDWVGCLAGHPQARTPNIRRLIESGVSFTQAHCNIPICNPSRASFLTGLYPFRLCIRP